MPSWSATGPAPTSWSATAPAGRSRSGSTSWTSAGERTPRPRRATRSLRAPGAPPAPDAAAAAGARARLEALATPPGALGRLGEAAVWWASVRGTPLPPPPSAVHLHVVAGDHGVTARGVSAFPAAVTPLMVGAFLDGGAAATVLARHLGVQVRTHDLAVDTDWPEGTDPRLYAHKVRRGSGSIDTEDALSPAETDAALAAGAAIADASVDAGADLLVVGDMGIGNTTPAAALVAALLGLDAAVATGRGTGVDDAGLARKTDVVRAALRRAGERHGDDPVRLLGALGGADLAAMAGHLPAGRAQAHPGPARRRRRHRRRPRGRARSPPAPRPGSPRGTAPPSPRTATP